MKISNLLIAVCMSVSSTYGFAATSALTFNASGNAIFGNQLSTTGSFDDYYTFNVAAGNLGTFTASASSGFLTLSETQVYGVDILGFDISSINGSEITNSTPIGGTISAVENIWSVTANNLAAGSYSLHVKGNAILSPFVTSKVSYGGEAHLAVSPVPEVETSSMMLLGLGLMGFIARRRSSK